MIYQPRSLIIETSGRVGHVALAEGDVLLESRQLDEARRHARDLVPQLAQLLDGRQWKPRDLQVVIVSRGPGSYTGLRVGIMSAKAFAFATGCPILAIDTFEAIAMQAPADVTAVDVLADAQQERVYVQRFVRGKDELPIAAAPLRIVSLAEWRDSLPAHVMATGPALHLLAGTLAGRIVSPQNWDPQPGSLLRLGLVRFRAGRHDDPWKMEPLYLRPSSAEEKWTALGR